MCQHRKIVVASIALRRLENPVFCEKGSTLVLVNCTGTGMSMRPKGQLIVFNSPDDVEGGVCVGFSLRPAVGPERMGKGIKRGESENHSHEPHIYIRALPTDQQLGEERTEHFFFVGWVKFWRERKKEVRKSKKGYLRVNHDANTPPLPFLDQTGRFSPSRGRPTC